MSEIQDAVQIIRVTYDGIEIAMKVGNGTVDSMKKALDFLVGMLDYEKTHGKTNMKKLLIKGGDLQVFQFQTQDMAKVGKLAKKYGILYSVLPDLNKKDGLSEIIFHAEAVPRINMIAQKMKFGRIATFDDYLKNGNEKDLEKVLSFLKEQKLGKEGMGFSQKSRTEGAIRANVLMEGLIEKVGLFAMEKQSISVDAVKENFNLSGKQAEDILKQLETIGVLERCDAWGEHKVLVNKEAFENRIRKYQDVADRMRAVSASKNLSLADVTISKQLIIEENDHAVKTRIPGGKGKCIWIDKQSIMEIHNGKTLLTFLDKEKEYKIYSADNRIMETMKGETLYQNHYDSVETTIRERYAKTQSQTQTKAASKKNNKKR